MPFLNPIRRLPLAALLATAVASGSVMAVDFTGYFRGGPGLTNADASRACYALNGGSSGMKFRLGNECDLYGEYQASQGYSKDGVDYRATIMANHYTNATDVGVTKLAIEQLWAEARGFDIAPNATFWIGKERGRRGDVHIVDTYFVEMAGVGAGMKGMPVGPGKLGVAFYKDDGGDASATQYGNRLNVEYMGVPTGADGALNFFGTATNGDFDGGKSGFGLSLRHDQGKLFGTGLSNTLFVQFAQGSAGLNSNFGNLEAGSAAKSWRIVESFNGQSGPVGGQAMLLVASEKDAAGKATDSLSVGGRVSYAFTRNFKLLTDVSLSQYKPEGGATARLTKVTLAPTLSVGPDFWTRPEFRLYVTSANWNDAAGNVTGQAAFEGKTSGTSYGAQVEWWF